MSLLKPTLGEMLDRITLLHFKIQHGSAADRDVTHFIQERTELKEAAAQKLEALPAVNSLQLWELLDYLEAAHRVLWEIIPTDSSERLLLANRRRHELREQIDRLAGEYQGPEKV